MNDGFVEIMPILINHNGHLEWPDGSIRILRASLILNQNIL
jgi:hypothetical protein